MRASSGIYKIERDKNMKRVTGIGGIFFKRDDPKKINEWYDKHLGISPARLADGAIFEWREKDKPEGIAHSVLGLFSKSSRYFRPSEREFLINYRVENLESLIEQLKMEGVEVVGEIEKYDYGKFGWIMDAEGNKIELWEPDDRAFREVNGLDKPS